MFMNKEVKIMERRMEYRIFGNFNAGEGTTNRLDYGGADDGDTELKVVVGCDCTRDTEKADIGVKDFANAWGEYLKDNEETLWENDSEENRSLLGDFTRKVLEKIANDICCSVTELGSTVMAVIVNETKKRWMVFHLGDGAIMRKNNEDNIYSFLSEPIYKPFQSFTYLTTSRNFERKLDIQKGVLRNIEGFALVAEKVFENDISRLTITKKICNMISERGVDQACGEQGIAAICIKSDCQKENGGRKAVSA